MSIKDLTFGTLFLSQCSLYNTYEVGIFLGFSLYRTPSYMSSKNLKLQDEKSYKKLLESVAYQNDAKYASYILEHSTILYQKIGYIACETEYREDSLEYIYKILQKKLLKPIDFKDFEYRNCGLIKETLEIIPDYQLYLTKNMMSADEHGKAKLKLFVNSVVQIDTVMKAIKSKYKELSDLQDNFESMQKPQQLNLGTAYVRKYKDTFDIILYLGKLSNERKKPYVFVRVEKDLPFDLYSSSINNIKADGESEWYVERRIRANRGKVSKLSNDAISSLYDTGVRIVHQQEYWKDDLEKKGMQFETFI